MLINAGEFDPSLHPHGADGKFTETGGSGVSLATKAAVIKKGIGEHAKKLMQKLIAEGKTKNEILEHFTSKYNAVGKTDPAWVKKQVARIHARATGSKKTTWDNTVHLGSKLHGAHAGTKDGAGGFAPGTEPKWSPPVTPPTSVEKEEATVKSIAEKNKKDWEQIAFVEEATELLAKSKLELEGPEEGLSEWQKWHTFYIESAKDKTKKKILGHMMAAFPDVEELKAWQASDTLDEQLKSFSGLLLSPGSVLNPVDDVEESVKKLLEPHPSVSGSLALPEGHFDKPKKGKVKKAKTGLPKKWTPTTPAKVGSAPEVPLTKPGVPSFWKGDPEKYHSPLVGYKEGWLESPEGKLRPKPDTTRIADDAPDPYKPPKVDTYLTHQKHAELKQAQEKAQPYTSEEHAAIYSYTGSGYHSINEKLRTGKESTLSPQQKAHVAALDAVTARAKIPGGVIVYRGLSLSATELESWKKSETLTFSAFSSTSIDPTRAFGGNVRLHIHTARGAALGGSNSQEKEVLLGRNWSYEITAIHAGMHGTTVFELKEMDI